MDFTSSVLARPGAPVIKQCPPENSASKICSTTSFCPTMTLLSSLSTRARPEMSFSTACASAAYVSVAISTMPFSWLMGHDVKNDIHRQGISDLLREMFKVIMVVSLPLPAISIVGVVRGENYQPPLVIEDGPMMGL